MMTLLQAHSLTGITQFQPESMPLNLSERQSTATITVGEEVPAIAVGDWIRDDKEPGKGIVWRVKTVDRQIERKTRTIQLEHMINTLRDQIMFGEVKPSDMGGGSTCTAEQAITYILDKQSDWTLGTCSYSVSNPYNFNGDDLFSALETVSSSLENCWWSYDFSSYPFKFNITPKSEAVGTELRMSRNIQTVKMTIDRTRMYTRFYPIGKNNLHIDGDYVSRNEGIYGRKDKTETDQSKSTKEELLQWANEKIAKHCEPSVTVTVTVLDIHKDTGENLDHIVVGALCRMPLAEYDTEITETITKISYQDKIAEPERATATLANEMEDVASIVNQLIKSGGGGGRAGAKIAEEDHAWFLDTSTHVAMIAEGVAGEGASQDWSRVAALVVDGDGIHQRVTQTQQDVNECFSLIDQTSTAIVIAIGNVTSQVYSFIEQTPEMIHSEVGAAVSGIAQSVIEQTATYIRTEVSNAASAISASVIEQTTEYVRTEVASVASGVAWSVVEQTMTGIIQEVHSKSKVYVQWTDPNNGQNVLNEGDIWIKRQENRTWNEANTAHEKWNQSGVAWKSKYGDLIYSWKNGKWNMEKDTSVDVENEVKLEQTRNSLAIVGNATDIQGRQFTSMLAVSAREIMTEVSTSKSQIYSTISQTATNIQAQVVNDVAGLQSQIEQTASSITTSVSAAKSSLYSTIMQTATSISTSVNEAKSSLYSTIMQTATQIRSEVVGKDGVISSINQTSEQVTIQASKINLSGYVTTSQLSSTQGDINNLKSGNAVFTLIAANRASLGRSGTGTVSVYGHTLVAYRVLDVNGTERRLFGYT